MIMKSSLINPLISRPSIYTWNMQYDFYNENALINLHIWFNGCIMLYSM